MKSASKISETHTNPKVYSRFNLPPVTLLKCLDETLTQQHFAEESDINNIVGRYAKTGILASANPGLGSRTHSYQDVSEPTSFHEKNNTLAEAKSAFENLSPELQVKFKNDPTNLIDFISDPRNTEEAVKLGLMVASEPEAPINVKVTNQTPVEPHTGLKPTESTND